MVVATGWIGITTIRNEQLTRLLVIVFGLGAGLIGDEIGLLLTFGDYTSYLTEIFFVAAIGFIILATLFSRARNRIQSEVLDIGARERLTHIGVFIGAFSAIFFAAGNWTAGLVVLGLGTVIFLVGFERSRKIESPHSSS